MASTERAKTCAPFIKALRNRIVIGVLTNVLKELTTTEAILLDNATCVYCGDELTTNTSTKEHVIGRRFVPKGTLNQQWNLIVRACLTCNSLKSELENDISAITMHPNAWGIHADNEEVLSKEAQRKGKKSYSRLTGKPVSQSKEAVNIKAPFSKEVEFNFKFNSPPQIESARVYELARMQLMAFFYFITFNNASMKGGFWTGGFYPVLEAQKLDWGNDVHVAFVKAVSNWEPKLIGNGADGYFKSAIRRHPSAACWSWAIEWNKNYRIVGFFGDQDAAKKVVDTFPDLSAQTVSHDAVHHLAYRIEKALNEDDDIMFSWDEGQG